MADNNVIKFRRIEKRPEKKPEPPQGAARSEPKVSAGRLSLLAWAVIIAASVAIVVVQQSGLLGG